ncbi:radical SAM protein [Chloroflexota bacterium]
MPAYLKPTRLKNMTTNFIRQLLLGLPVIRKKISKSASLECQPFENIDIGRCPLPTDAYFLVNNRCNARCVMCSVEGYFSDNSAKRITLDKFKIIAGNLHLENFKSVILSSAGEPLLNGDVPDIISFINRNYPHICIIIITNGIALTPQLAGELVGLNVHLLSVSLNAGTRETYKKVMQVDCFERVVGNIKYYQELGAKAGKQPDIWLSFVAHRKNLEDLSRFIELGKTLDVKLLTTTYSRFYPESQRLKMALSDENFLDENDSLFFHQELSDRYFREAEKLARKLGIKFVREPLFSEAFHRKKCEFPFTAVLVGVDGEVFPCCNGEVIFKEKVRKGYYKFGNLLEQDIKDFWNDSYYRAVRYSVLNPDNPAVPECGVCAQSIMWNGHIQKCHILEWGGLSDKSVDFGLVEYDENGWANA